MKEAACEALEQYGVGAGGSRLTTGTGPLHVRLEEELARFKGREAALVFNTGYMANVGILSALMGRGDVIFSDQLNHASIIDGCRLSGRRWWSTGTTTWPIWRPSWGHTGTQGPHRQRRSVQHGR